MWAFFSELRSLQMTSQAKTTRKQLEGPSHTTNCGHLKVFFLNIIPLLSLIIDSVERDWKRDHVGLSSVCNKRKGQRAVQASINAATSAKLRTFRDTKDKVFSYSWTKVTLSIALRPVAVFIRASLTM